jgi:hypothetical protein
MLPVNLISSCIFCPLVLIHASSYIILRTSLLLDTCLPDVRAYFLYFCVFSC